MGRYFIGENPSHYLSHSGRLGQRWGIRNGPPYPLNREAVSRAYGSSSGISNQALSAELGRRAKLRNGFSIQNNKHDSRPIVEEAKKVNPRKPGEKYRDYNCAYCTIAYDMRRRGYDVIAANKYLLTTKEVIKSYSTSKDDFNNLARSSKTFSNSNGEKEWNGVKKPTEERSKEIYDWANSELKKQGVGARGMFNVAFGDDVGHAMNYEVTNNGVRLIDSQSGDIYRLSEITPYCTDVLTFRTDNIEPNYAYIKRKGMVLNA